MGKRKAWVNRVQKRIGGKMWKHFAEKAKSETGWQVERNVSSRVLPTYQVPILTRREIGRWVQRNKQKFCSDCFQLLVEIMGNVTSYEFYKHCPPKFLSFLFNNASSQTALRALGTKQGNFNGGAKQCHTRANLRLSRHWKEIHTGLRNRVRQWGESRTFH